MGPHHPASETAGQRAQAHDADDNLLDSNEPTDEKSASSSTATTSKEKGDPTNRENVIR